MPKGNPKGYDKPKKGSTAAHKSELAAGGSYGPQKPLGAISMTRRVGKK